MGKRQEREREMRERERERGEGRESERKKEKESVCKRVLTPPADLVVRKPLSFKFRRKVILTQPPVFPPLAASLVFCLWETPSLPLVPRVSCL